ncbi:centromere protein O-like [Amphiura filiformis]|uniref:centromere protein O-like n=1 Tax=Amphiura filiformis TaxID=82378 RepID=UPI003B218580
MTMEQGVLSIQRLNKGALQTLQQLEDTAEKVSDSEENHVKHQQHLNALQKAVQALQIKRDQLKKDLQNTPWKVLRSSVLDEKDGQLCMSSRSDRTGINEESIQEALSAALKVKAQHTLTHTCRLTGCSVTSVMKGKHKHIRICWDTFSNRQYCEPYYMELQTSRNHNSLSISRHSLPYFLPINSMSQDLNNDITGFVNCVKDYLNAYISRRQQAFTLQNQHNTILDGEVHTSASFDNITFDLKLTNQSEPCTASIALVFDNLLLTSPSRVFVRIKDGDISRSASRKLCNHLQSVLAAHPLHIAVDKLK